MFNMLCHFVHKKGFLHVGSHKKKKKLALWSLRAICHSVIKFGMSSLPLFHLASAFRMQKKKKKKGETFNVQRESWCKREQNMSDMSEDVRCLKSCSSELTGIPIGRPYFTFLWETVSASPWEVNVSHLCSLLNLFINPFRKLTANIKGQIKMKVKIDLCAGLKFNHILES